jgi:hypothetical protein
MVRSVLAGHCQFRFWEGDEACMGLMRQYDGRLRLLMGVRRRRLAAAGFRCRLDAADALAPFPFVSRSFSG